jgi:SNF2 family DNA or RNA helicase
VSIEDARAKLIQLEIERQAQNEKLDDTTAQLDQILKAREEADRTLQRQRKEIDEAKKALQREQDLAASKAQSDYVHDNAEILREHFERMAEGRVWWDGILPHQKQGVMFGAVAKRWILGDVPGLGKTWQSIGWLDLVDAQKVIVVLPADICDQWAGEAMTLAPHRNIVTLAKKTPKRRHALLDELVQRDEGVAIVNYEIWRRDESVLIKLMQWQADTLIVDEAHALKNTSSSNFKKIKMLAFVENTCASCGVQINGTHEQAHHPLATRKLRPCYNCGWKLGEATGETYDNPLDDYLKTRSIKNTLFTTGTPILNSPEDIYALLHLCDPILFKAVSQFLTTYCRENYMSGKWEFRPGAVQNLKPLIEGRFLARTYEDAGVVIPTQHVHITSVDLDKELYKKQYRVITQLSKAAQILLDNGNRATIMHLIALVTRKRQANVWPGGIEIKDEEGNVIFSVGDEVQESVKMDYLMDNVQQFLADGHRQVVFSQFKTALAELEQRMKAAGMRVVRLDGDTPEHLRAEIKTNFYRAKGETPKWDVLLCNYKTGGVGLNLTSITKTHILDEEWNPGKRDQAYARSARMGQSEETDVYVYRIPGSIDTWMSNTIYRKEKLIGEFTEEMTEQKDDLMMSLRDAIESGEIL